MEALAILALVGFAYGEEASEYQIKAAYIYNFAKAADWPAQIPPNSSAALVIGVLGGAMISRKS